MTQPWQPATGRKRAAAAGFEEGLASKRHKGHKRVEEVQEVQQLQQVWRPL